MGVVARMFVASRMKDDTKERVNGGWTVSRRREALQAAQPLRYRRRSQYFKVWVVKCNIHLFHTVAIPHHVHSSI